MPRWTQRLPPWLVLVGFWACSESTLSMNRALAHRLARLEHQTRACNAPCGLRNPQPPRFRAYAIAGLQAALHAVRHGQAPPVRDETQGRAERADEGRMSAFEKPLLSQLLTRSVEYCTATKKIGKYLPRWLINLVVCLVFCIQTH
jgi:hypothetical protein